jgi:endonuclease-3
MHKKKRAQKIQKILQDLYPSPPIPLLHKDSYTLLIAVLLSARCTDARVNQITPLLFARADAPEKMITLSVAEIQKMIRPCGLSERKATAIWDLSYILLEKYGGKVPQDLAALEALPGVGHKTASVVMAQAFKEPAFPVDTHIRRCAIRWKLSRGKSVKQIEKDLKLLFARKDWIPLHLQIIVFARQHCPARSHNAAICPICSWVD